jgi:steroid delta-isomerase-like uncharacterized protein
MTVPASDSAALVREILEAIDAGDLVRTGELLDEGFVLHYNGVPDSISKAPMIEMLRAYYDAFADLRHDVQQILPSVDYVTVRLVTHATHRGTYEGIPATGRQVAVGAIHIMRIDGGRIVEWWAAEDDLGLLRQVGAVIA